MNRYYRRKVKKESISRTKKVKKEMEMLRELYKKVWKAYNLN